MHQNVDFVGRQREQVGGFDDFEPLVHHRGRIDRDLLAHAPVRMFQRLRQCRLFDVGGRPGAERSARCGDDYPHQFLAVSGAERLKQRVMFGIGRQDAGTGLRRALHEEIAGADQAFLVGKRHRCAAVDRRQRRLQSGRAAHRRHHPVCRPRRRLDDGALARAAFGARAGQRFLQLTQSRRVSDRRKSRIEFFGELGQASTLLFAVSASTR